MTIAYHCPTTAGLTTGRIPYSSDGCVLSDSANLTFNGTALSVVGKHTQQVIDTPTTFYLAPSGSDSTGDGTSGTPWLTIAKAMSYLAPFSISAQVTITMADGGYSTAAVTDLSHPFGRYITLTGTNTYTKTIDSVVNYSGSPGAYSVILQLTTSGVANITVNDYILLSNCAGGNTPSYLDGCHLITNVDTGNKRITITCKHKATWGIGINCSTATAVVIPTIIVCAGDGLALTQSNFKQIKNLVLVGPGATNTGLTTDGVSVCNASPNLGICNFQYAYNIENGSRLTVNTSAFFASGCTIGCLAQSNSSINAFYAIMSGNTYGFYALQGASIDAEQSVATGNTTGYQANYFSNIRTSGNTATGNTTDYNPTLNTIAANNSLIAS